MDFTDRPTIKMLTARRRHLGMTALDRTKARRLQEYILAVVSIYSRVKYSIDEERKAKIKEKILRLLRVFHDYVGVPLELANNTPLPPIDRKHRTIDSFLDEEIPIYFRFRSKAQLHDLMRGFQIPAKFTSRCGRVFFGEETLLASLYRLHLPTTVTDAAFKELFGLYNQSVSDCVHCFLSFMIPSWGYFFFTHHKFKQLPLHFSIFFSYKSILR